MLKGMIEALADMGRNPFVNQVVCFREANHDKIKEILSSQSLRKSGRLFLKYQKSVFKATKKCRNPFVNQVVCFMNTERKDLHVVESQSLRKSGRLFHSGRSECYVQQ